jgi:hypothetical protein
MKRLTRKGKLMVFLRRNKIGLTAAGAMVAWTAFWLFWIAAANADELPAAKPQCPDPGVKCKILYLNESEERLLAGQNGILDTAAQARALDLGQFAVYLKTKIGIAPQGEVQPSPSGSGSAGQPSPSGSGSAGQPSVEGEKK